MYYTVLYDDGTDIGGAKWCLPNGDTPGEWMPPIEGALHGCRRGYWLFGKEDLVEWLGPTIYEAEYRGEMLETYNMIVVREARLLKRLRWDETIARLFACACAEHVLPLFEEAFPNDPRPREAIQTVRDYVAGKATKEQLAAAYAAAGDAAFDAPWGAALFAAWAASDAASRAAWRAARDAALRAAWAARDAAREVVWGPAEAAEKDWQTGCLLGYLCQ